MRIISLISIIVFVNITNLFAQDSAKTSLPSQDSGIKVSASVSTKEVPLNRSLKFTIQVEWFGDLKRYEISEVENPATRNFKITSNSSSDRRELVNGKLKAIKTFEFELVPEELGMGYIDGVIVKYIDTETGEGKHLITNRLDAKVIDPIPEPGSKTWLIKWIILAIIIAGLAVAIILWLRKKAEEKRKKAELTPLVPIEEDYLQELKNSVLLESPDLDIKNAFSTISLVFRKYLATRYNFGATNAITEEIIATLKQNEIAESLINNTQEILNTCDVAKFSGSEGQKADLERVYTLVEDLLNKNLKMTSEL